MDGEFTEKVKEKRQKRGISITLLDVPVSVNRRLKGYQRRISVERGKKLNLKTAYVEFLKEHTKDLV